MKKWGNTVTNKPSRKGFFVSTVPVNPLGEWIWQTAVFKQRFGPFAGFFRPVLFVGASSELFAEGQHQQVIDLVREIPLERWDNARDQLLLALVNEESAHEESEREDFYQKLLKANGH